MPIREKIEIDFSEIVFKQVTYNQLRRYITGRRMTFDCRINPWDELLLCIGVFYRGFLCGGTLVKQNPDGIPVILTWYSREDRAKKELLNKTTDCLLSLGHDRARLVVQKKWLSDLLCDGWSGGGKVLEKELKNED